MFRRLTALACAAVVAAGLMPAAPAHAVDVYTTPGIHNVNGRQWRTTCEMYSKTVERCRTEIMGNLIQRGADGRYTVKRTWVFNNLTYKSSPRSSWGRWHPLVVPGEHTVGNRKWRTECATSWTGPNGCRSQIYGTVVERRGETFTQKNAWIFNNIVVLTAPPCPVSRDQLRKQTGNRTAVIHECTHSKQNQAWAAVDHSVEAHGEISMVTTFWKRGSRGWQLQATSGRSASHLCSWYQQAKLPRDLAGAVPYCFR